MLGMIDPISAESTGSPEMSRFHGLSFGKMRQPACTVPGPGTPPLEDAGPPELEVEVPPELLDAPGSSFPHATTTIAQATTAKAESRTRELIIDGNVTRDRPSEAPD